MGSRHRSGLVRTRLRKSPRPSRLIVTFDCRANCQLEMLTGKQPRRLFWDPHPGFLQGISEILQSSHVEQSLEKGFGGPGPCTGRLEKPAPARSQVRARPARFRKTPKLPSLQLPAEACERSIWSLPFAQCASERVQAWKSQAGTEGWLAEACEHFLFANTPPDRILTSAQQC